MTTHRSKQFHPARRLLAVALLGLGAIGCGHEDLGTVKLNGKLPRVYAQATTRTPASALRGRRPIDRLPRKSVKQIAQTQARNS